MTRLARSVSEFIAREGLLTPGCRVVIGLSGGTDSAALLAVLRELDYGLIAVHCHFGLRGEEADRDLEHSRQLAERFGAEFRYVHFNTPEYMAQKRISAEMACRELRYDYFEQVRSESGAEAIAVAHHREDNVETFFLNLLRGSGLHGLRAMLPKRENIVRPFLETPRKEILDYLREQGIEYIIDSTNLQNDFKRNRLRNKVIPLIEAEFPGAIDAVARSVSHLRDYEAGFSEALMLHERYGFRSDDCRRILVANPGATFTSKTHRLTMLPGGGYEVRLIDEKTERPRLCGRIIPRPEPFIPSPGVVYLDADTVPVNGRWELRLWRPSDRIKPFGMKGSKPVSDLMASAGISATARREAYVVTLNEEIIWVVGVRASSLYPVTDKTKKIIEIYHEKV